jgi:hypothetical protein
MATPWRALGVTSLWLFWLDLNNVPCLPVI